MHPLSLLDVLWVPAGVAVVVAATAFGVWALDRLGLSFNRALDVAFGGALGMMTLALATFALSLASFIPTWLMVAMPAAMAAVGGRALRRRLRGARVPDRATAWTGVALAAMTLALLGAAANPPAHYDDLEYHYVLPKECFNAGGYVRLDSWNVLVAFPQNVEMLHLYGMALTNSATRGIVVGRTFNIAMALLLAAGVYGTMRAFVEPATASVAAGLAVVLPGTAVLMVGRCSTEIAQSLGGFLAGSAAVWIVARGAPPMRTALLGGLMAGFASGAKYPSVVFCAIPIAAILLVMGRGRAAVVFGAAALAAFAPWAIRNVVEHGNPIFPMAYDLFPSDYWSAQELALWKRFTALPAGWTAGMIVDEVRNDLTFNPLLLVLPIALPARWRRLVPVDRAAAWLLVGVTAAYLGVWWFATHRYIRFLVPVYPWLAALGALAMVGVAERLLRVLSGVWIGGVTLLVVLMGVTAAIGRAQLSDEQFVRNYQADMEPILLVNAHPGGGKVLLVGEARTFPLTRPYVAATVFNRHPFLSRLDAGATPAELRAWLELEGVTLVLVNWSEVRRLSEFAPEVFRSLRPGVFEAMGLRPLATTEGLRDPTVVYEVRPN